MHSTAVARYDMFALKMVLLYYLLPDQRSKILYVLVCMDY